MMEEPAKPVASAESELVPALDGATPGPLPPAELKRLTDEIIGALKCVFDPEIPCDVYELGLIYKVDIADDRAITVDMTLTTPNCPSAAEIPLMVENAVQSVGGVELVTVNVVWDPPWDQSRMSDEARKALSMWSDVPVHLESEARTVSQGVKKALDAALKKVTGWRKRNKKTPPNDTKVARKGAPTSNEVNGAKSIRTTTTIGASIVQNRTQIIWLSGGLSMLIDERLTELRAKRPNSPKEKRARAAQIAAYQSLKRQADLLREATDGFARGETKEAAVVSSAKTFEEGVSSWWSSHHSVICDKVMDMGLFTFAVGLCCAAGVSSPLSVLLPGALVAGESVSNVLRAYGKQAYGSLKKRKRP